MNSQERLAGGRVWPLRKRSILEACDAAEVLRPDGIARDPRVSRDDNRVLEVSWHERTAFTDRSFSSVVLHSVPSADQAAIERELRASALPELVEWLRHASDAPEGWIVTSPHRFVWRWENHRLVAQEEPDECIDASASSA
jgi:hypothetical protein